MKLRHIFLFFVLSFLMAQERIAITEFDPSGVNSTTARNITNRFSYELSKANKFEIVERELMDKILEEQKFQNSGCVANECAVEIGQMIGVSLIVAGNVSKIEDLYSLNIRLIDVETGKIIYQDMDDYEGSVKDFIQVTIKNMALRMAAEASKSQKTDQTQMEQFTSTKKGDVIFNVDQPSVAIYIDGRYSSRSSGNQVLLSIAEGPHTIRFSSDGFKDWEKDINVLGDQELSFDVAMKKGTSKAEKASTGILLVRSSPSQATVFVDGIEKGSTLLQITDIGVGEHEIRIEKNLYYSHSEKINIQPDVISEVKGDLKPNFGSLTIQSTPSGSVVQIDGQTKGKTPYSIEKIQSGSYHIQVSRDLYHTHEENYIITDGSENNLDIRLTPAFGTLIITSNPSQADVELDGQVRGQTPLTIDELPSGDYHLTLQKELFQSIEQSITIEDGQTHEKNIELDARSGLLSITGSPNSSDIYANGNLIGQVPLKNVRIQEGVIELTIKSKNHYDKTEYLTINRNETISKTIDLTPHTGKIIVVTEPPDADVYLDNKLVGTSPSILSGIFVGDHTIQVKHPDYLEQSESFNLLRDEKKELRFKLITYTGSVQQKIDRADTKLKWLIGGTSLLASVGVWSAYLGEEKYQLYLDAQSSEGASTYYFSTQILDAVSTGLLISSGISTLYTLKQSIELNKLKKYFGIMESHLTTKLEPNEGDTITDIDGNVYQTVLIGNQVWMAENLKVSKYRDGTAIATGHSNSAWANLSSGAYAMYDDNSNNGETYGYLYNWYAVDDSRNIAPEGWHIPTDNEWQELVDYLGGSSVAGGKMKETGTNHWNSPNTDATNESGFTALPGGYRYYNGFYSHMGNLGTFWSSTESNSYTAWYRLLHYNRSDVYRYYYGKRYGFSVRCIRD